MTLISLQETWLEAFVLHFLCLVHRAEHLSVLEFCCIFSGSCILLPSSRPLFLNPERIKLFNSTTVCQQLSQNVQNRVYQTQVLELDNEVKSVFKIKLGPQNYRILCLEKY